MRWVEGHFYLPIKAFKRLNDIGSSEKAKASHDCLLGQGIAIGDTLMPNLKGEFLLWPFHLIFLITQRW